MTTMSPTQGITVRYIGPTDTKGARLKATSASGISVTIPYPHDAPERDKPCRAVDALCDKLGWDAAGFVGATIRGNDWAFVKQVAA